MLWFTLASSLCVICNPYGTCTLPSTAVGGVAAVPQEPPFRPQRLIFARRQGTNKLGHLYILLGTSQPHREMVGCLLLSNASLVPPAGRMNYPKPSSLPIVSSPRKWVHHRVAMCRGNVGTLLRGYKRKFWTIYSRYTTSPQGPWHPMTAEGATAGLLSLVIPILGMGASPGLSFKQLRIRGAWTNAHFPGWP